jgi:hypothetical protein
MASDYPFRRILGVEAVPDLHRIAQENIRKYRSESQRCFQVESVCSDARDFQLPNVPLVLYLFNPLPEAGLQAVGEKLRLSLREHPRPLYVVYHNPLLEHVLTESGVLRKLSGDLQYAVFEFPGSSM